jgi:hypothetical protein
MLSLKPKAGWEEQGWQRAQCYVKAEQQQQQQQQQQQRRQQNDSRMMGWQGKA